MNALVEAMNAPVTRVRETKWIDALEEAMVAPVEEVKSEGVNESSQKKCKIQKKKFARFDVYLSERGLDG